jgi:hypothetical protein
MLLNPAVASRLDGSAVTNFETRAIHKANPRAATKAVPQIGAQRQKGTGHPFDKSGQACASLTLIADQGRKSRLPMGFYLFKVKRLKVTVRRLVKGNQDSHDFTQTQSACSLAVH